MTEGTQVDTQAQAQPRNELGQFAPQPDSIVNNVMSNANAEGQVDAFASAGEQENSASVNDLMGIPEQLNQESVANEEPQVEQPVQKDVDNGEVRYQYWQSQADKAKNDLTSMREQNQLLQNQLNLMNQQTQPQAQEKVAPKEEDFPPPPERPAKPRNFNREEAYTDPSSSSAQYLDDIEEWRDTMDEYNQLHTKYQTELAKAERMDFVEQQKKQQSLQEAQRQQYQQMNSMANYVKEKYNANDDEIRDFYNKFSSDESITVDNLWQLYQLGKGQAQQPVPQQASPVFEQTKRAQQVASPMGVVSGANSQAQGSAEDQIMDSLINNYKSKNPF